MRKIVISLLIAIQASMALGAPPQPALDWVQQAGGSGFDRPAAAAVDPEGNLFVAGFFQNSAWFGPFNLTGTTTAFLAKYTPAGTVSWASTVLPAFVPNNPAWATWGTALVADPEGNIYLGGQAQTAVVVTNAPSGSVQTNYPYYGFIAKLTATGQLLWCRTNGGPSGTMSVTRLALDGANHLYAAGTFTGQVAVGTNSFTAASTDCQGLYVAQYSAQGDFGWALQGGGAPFSYADGVAPLADGSILVAARLGASGWFNGYTNHSPTNLFVRLSPSGKLLSTRDIPFPADRGLAVDTSGAMYTCTVRASPDRVRITLSKYDSGGGLLWSQVAADAYDILSAQLALGAFGDLWLGVSAQGDVNFGTNHFRISGIPGAFVVRYDLAGACEWVGAATGWGGQASDAVVADPSGGVYWLGEFCGQDVSIGDYVLTNRPSGLADIFATKFKSLPPQLALTLTGANFEFRWPSWADSFQLECSGFIAGQPWTTPATAPTNDGVQFHLVMPMTNASRFFRLRLRNL